MAGRHRTSRESTPFLSSAGPGRKILRVAPRQAFFTQGAASDSVFYLREGTAKVTVVSRAGKEATIMLLFPGDFVGEEALVSTTGLRASSAIAITACDVLKICPDAMVQAMNTEQWLRDHFLKYLLKRSIRVQADLVDHLFNSSEKRLARILLLMGGFDLHEESQRLIPRISQETLAEMVGTTRSRVSYFMNRFRRLGLIEYSGRIRVHRSLLSIILNDEGSQDTGSFTP